MAVQVVFLVSSCHLSRSLGALLARLAFLACQPLADCFQRRQQRNGVVVFSHLWGHKQSLQQMHDFGDTSNPCDKCMTLPWSCMTCSAVLRQGPPSLACMDSRAVNASLSCELDIALDWGSASSIGKAEMMACNNEQTVQSYTVINFYNHEHLTI